MQTAARRPHAVVTGSSSGIGAAVARRLLVDGWRVSGLDVAAPTLSEVGLIHHGVDLADAAACRRVVAELLVDGPPQAWVHAAGVLRTAPLGALREDDGQQMWVLHVQAASVLADALLPAMARAGHGRAVLVGSRIWRGQPGRSQYAATKAALLSLARSWAGELASQGVTVNVVSPAATDTPMLTDPRRVSSAPRLPPIGRLIQPAEVAALVAFLLGDSAAAITGQDIAICGGASVVG